jgi:hypothetical protein
MKSLIRQVISADIYTSVFSVISALLVFFILILYISNSRLEKEKTSLNNQTKEIQLLRSDVIQIKDFVESKEKKIGLVKTRGIVSTLEPMLSSLGLKANVIKPLEKKRVKDFTEEEAELEIENIDLNTIVNLFYKLEHSPVPLKIKRSTLQTTFENPDIFILTLTTALITK